MLIVGKHAMGLGLQRVHTGNPVPVLIQRNAPLIGNLNAHDTFDQRGFSGAVLSYQRPHLTFVYCKAHVLQCGYSGIKFTYMFNF